MNQYFNWTDVGRMYKLLGFNETNIAEGRCVGFDEAGELRKLISREYFTDQLSFVEWAHTFNGQGNIFVGRNPRSAVGSKDIRHISCITLDIDPIRPKNQAATQNQMEESFHAGQVILDRFMGGSICGSGNGCLVIWTTDSPIVADFKAFEGKLKSFQDECAELVKDYKGVRIDATQDSARLIKLIGTLSIKGGTRVTRFLRVSNRAGDGNAVFRHVAEFKTSQPATKEMLLAKARSDDRSGNDFALALHYKKNGLSPADTLDALAHHALGRPDRHDDHVRIVSKVFGTDSPEEKVQNPDEIVLHSPKTSLGIYIESLSARGKNEKPELPTGFEELDRATHGLRRGEVYTVAARPAVGKSSMLLNISDTLCGFGRRVLLLSTEMPYQAIWDRLFSIGAEIDGSRFNTGIFTDIERDRRDKFHAKFKDYDFHVCDAFSPSIKAVEKTVDTVKPDVVMFDHLQHIEGGEDYKALSLFTQQLKSLAMRTGIAVVAASQLKRPFQAMNFRTGDLIQSKPSLNDLKGCGKIEEESAFVVLLHPTGANYKDNVPVIRAELAKNRFGPTAVSDLAFFKNFTRFKSLEECNGR